MRLRFAGREHSTERCKLDSWLAWAGMAGGGPQAAVAEHEAAIAELEQLLTKMTEAQQLGTLGPAEAAQLEELHAEYQALVSQYQAMVQQLGVATRS